MGGGGGFSGFSGFSGFGLYPELGALPLDSTLNMLTNCSIILYVSANCYFTMYYFGRCLSFEHIKMHKFTNSQFNILMISLIISFSLNSYSPCSSFTNPVWEADVMFNALHVVDNDKWSIFLLFVFLYRYDTRLSYLNKCEKRDSNLKVVWW